MFFKLGFFSESFSHISKRIISFADQSFNSYKERVYLFLMWAQRGKFFLFTSLLLG